MTASPDPAAVDAVVGRIRDSIDRHGWAVVYVFPTDPDPVVPFAYTVGLTAHQHPELLVAGLPDDAAHALLNDLAGRVLAGRRLQDGEVLDDLIVGHPARLRAGVPVDPLVPGMVRAVHGPFEGAALLQLLWPDDHGRFPDEAGYDPRMRQPLLEVPL